MMWQAWVVYMALAWHASVQVIDHRQHERSVRRLKEEVMVAAQ